MEIKLILWLLLGLFLAFTLTRISAIALHDSNNYNSDKTKNLEKIKTPTALLRSIFERDIHHIHLGIILLIIVGVLIYLDYINPLSLFLLGISVSWILDQFFPLINLGNYFSIEMTLISFLLHLIMAITLLILSFLKFAN